MLGQKRLILAAVALVLFGAPEAMAAEGEVALTPAEVLFWVNNTWMLMAAFMVFVMHLGFAALEAGMTQSKNTVNILHKFIMKHGKLIMDLKK